MALIERTRREYLAAMGIDVWVLRSDLPASTFATAFSQSSARQPAQESAAGDGPSRAKALQRELGKREDKPASAKRAAPRRVNRASAGDTPEFRLALLDYGKVGLCVHLQPHSQGASQSAGEELPRRFCDDVARSAGGSVDKLKSLIIDWPMVKSSSIDQSIDEAREVVSAKMRDLPKFVIVMGESVPDYFPVLAGMKPGEQRAQDGTRYIMTLSPAQLMNSADAKRNLWQLINNP